MRRSFCFILIFVSFILQSCATIYSYDKRRLELEKFAQENPGCCIEKAYLGAVIIINRKNEIEVAKVLKDTPADKADLRPGDVVLKIDGQELKSKHQAFVLYDSKYPGAKTTLTVKRADKILTKQFQLLSHHFLNVQYKLLEIAYKEIPIRLAVVFGNIDYGNVSLKDLFKSQSYYIGVIENNFLSAFRNLDNFSIIDRQKTNTVLTELKFQASGLVDNKTREELGKMLGATHLLVTDITILNSEDNQDEILYVMRLIEIASGKTLAVSTFKMKIKKSNILAKLDLHSYYEKIKKISSIEEEAVMAYASVTGKNYKDDATFLNMLNNTIIPKHQEYRKQLASIKPNNSELENAHKIYIEGVDLQLESMFFYQTAVIKQNKNLIEEGNRSAKLAQKKIEIFKKEMDKLLKKYSSE